MNYDLETIKRIIFQETNQVIDDNLSENEILEIYYNHLIKTESVPWHLVENKLLFNKCQEKENYRLICQFSTTLLTEDFIASHLNEIYETCKEKKNIPISLRKKTTLLQRCITEKNYELVCFFDSSILTNEIIAPIIENIYEYAKSNQSIPYVFQNNQLLFNKCLQEENYRLMFSFNEELISSIISDDYMLLHIEQIYQSFKESVSIPQSLQHNKILFNKYIQEENYEAILKKNKFDQALIDEYISHNVEKVYNYVKEEFYLSISLFQNKDLFNKCLQESNYRLICKFASSLLTEDFIKSHINDIYNYAQEINCIPIYLKKSKVLFDKCNQESNYALIYDFHPSLLNQEYIESHKDEIYNYLKSKQYILNLDSLRKNSTIFDKCIQEENYKLAFSFFNGELIDNYVSHNLEKVYSFIKENKYLTLELSFNKMLFDKCNQESNYELICHFSYEFLTTKYVQEHLNEIYNYVKQASKIPSNLYSNKILFDKCYQEENYQLIFQFIDKLVTETFIKDNVEAIYNYYKDSQSIPYTLKNSSTFFNKCMQMKNYSLAIETICNISNEEIDKYYNDLKQEINEKHNYNVISYFEKNDYFLFKLISDNQKDILKYLRLPQDILTNQEYLEYYSNILNISREDIIYKLSILLKTNDEILPTLRAGILDKRINMDYKKIDYIGPYSDIQNMIISLNDNELTIYKQILDMLNSKDYDLNAVTYEILKNIKNYQALINNISSHKLNVVELANLVRILMLDKNIYNINNIDDLKNYPAIVNKFNLEFKNKLDQNEIDIESLRERILTKNYNLSLERAKFILNRYCKDYNLLIESNINKNIKLTILSLYMIVNTPNYEKLKAFYNLNRNSGFYSAIALESKIRNEFARLYLNTLYKPSDEDILKQKDFQSKNLYERLANVNYKGKRPKIHVLDKDFNMIISVTYAYSLQEYIHPTNWKEDWERPKIANHGFCTSYIGNNQIANARQYHPCYGFTSLYPGNLLLSQNADISSRYANEKFMTSYEEPCNFLSPKQMIDNTRHTHNEMVFERRNLKEGKSFKVLPSYVVYFVDDINNESNFDIENNELFRESIEASIDNDIPLVIVDRLKYAKREQDKINTTIKYFTKNPNEEKLQQIICEFINNMIGCQKFEKQELSTYHQMFNIESLQELLNNLYSIINTFNEQEKIYYQKYLAFIIKSEINKILHNYIIINKEYNNKISETLQNYYDKLNIQPQESIQNISQKIIAWIMETPDIDVEKIIKDVNNNINLIDVYNNAINGYYSLKHIKK